MDNTVLYLIGHYGVGKYTIAKAICARSDAKLFDNHLINNVVFSLIENDGSTPLPPRVWDFVWDIRKTAVSAIAELGAPQASYVLTNALTDAEMDKAAFEQVADLARMRGATFVPVMLAASDEAFAQRIPSLDRFERFKHTDVASAAARRAAMPLLDVRHPNRLDLDTTSLAPDHAAEIIIAHAKERSRP